MTFRHWLQEMWQEHCDELLSYGQFQERRDLKPEDYFQKYKWWLKREYKQQQKVQTK